MSHSKLGRTLLAAASIAAGLVLVTANPAFANHHIMRIRTVFVGTQTTANDAQYIELQMLANGQSVLNTHKVKVYDSAGATTAGATFTFTANVANGQDQASVLIATPKASEMFGGIVADLAMTPVIDPTGGKVCFQTSDTVFVDCVTYGTYSPPVAETGAKSGGTPYNVGVGLPTSGQAIVRDISRGTANIIDTADDIGNSSVDFVSGIRPPRNNAHDVSTKAGVGSGTYEDGSAEVQQIGGPWTTASDPADSGGSTKSSIGAAASQELTFVGQGIKWLSRLQPNAGTSDVYIDNIKVATIDLYAATAQANQIVYENLAVPAGTHTIRVTRTGTKNAASSSTLHIFDAFVVVASDTTAPGAPGGLVATLSGSAVDLTWSANGEPDLAGYNAYRSTTAGGPYTKSNAALITTTNYTDTTGVLGAVNYYVVRAQDTSANESANSNEVSKRLPVGPGTYEENNANVTLVGTWSTLTSAGDSGGAVRYSNSAGASAQLTFTGTSVSWVARRQANAGISHVFIDGVNIATVDLYNPSTQLKVTVYSKNDLAPGTHTIRVVRTGTKNASATGGAHFLDAFVVPDTTPPAAPTGLAATGGAIVNLTWNPNGEANLAGYNVYRSATTGGPYTKLNGPAVTGTAYTDSAPPPGTTQFYVVRAQTTAAIESAPSNEVSVVVPNPVGPGTYEENNANVTLVGTWSTLTSAGDSGGAVRYSNSAGASAQLTFTGTSVSWVARRQANAGISHVFIDGVNIATVDLYNPSTQLKVTVYSKNDLAPGTHTIRVVRTGTKNASATGGAHFLDAFVVPDTTPPAAPTGLAATGGAIVNLTWNPNGEANLAGYNVYRSATTGGPYTKLNGPAVTGTAYTDSAPPPGTTQFYVVRAQTTAAIESAPSNEVSVVVPNPVGPGTYEENNANVTLVGTWSTLTSAGDSGGAVRYSNSAGASAQLTFTGTSVSWVARRQANAGISHVFIDGVNIATVDLYNPSTQLKVTVYSKNDLAPGTHTIRVVRTGTKNASATGGAHFLDAFVVA